MTVNTQELRELLEKATPGKWVADGKAVSSDHGHRTSICGTYGIAWPCGSYSNAEADAALIAAARNALPALPALLDEIDALRAELQARQWMPIETAPKDGRTMLLGYFNSHHKWRTVRGQWMSEDYIAEYWEDPDGVEPGWFETSVEADDIPNCWPIDPTHWMPLPPAPPQGDGA